MKKIILLISLLIVFVGVQAQDFSMDSKAYYKSYIGTAGDTISGTNSLTKTILLDKDYLYYYEVLADIDTLVGSYGVSCILSASNDGVNFVTLTDVTFAATADTIIRYSNLSASGTQTFGSYTITQPAYQIIQDSATVQLNYADTINVPQVISTVSAQTVTAPAEAGVMWRFLKLTLTGDNASTSAELQAIRVRLIKVP